MSKLDSPASSTAPLIEPSPQQKLAWGGVGMALVIGLAWLVMVLTKHMPTWTEGTWFGPIAKSVEFPVYAIVLGFAFNGILSLLGIRERLSAAFRTEFFIKIGLVLLGATVNINVILSAAAPAIIQGVLMIATVFLFTWWFAGVLGIENHLRALLASALSVCGVSAAVAAAGAVHAKKEQLAYTAGLVIVFALPSIFILPWLAGLMGLTAPVAGAWIGGNIDTTAAVTAAGAVAGEDVLDYAAIVKMTQNAMIGFVAVALSLYFTLRIDRDRNIDGTRAAKAGWGEVWQRFPKFVLGFIAASVLVSVLAAMFPIAADEGWLDSGIAAAKELQTLFFTLAFVSIGLEFKFGALREAGWKPVIVFLGGTIVNLIVGLFYAQLLFGWIFGSQFN
ncbi:putative sulfate exporter family transporter [Gulosibacter macacae]|uniref:Putative sulfate exporter family transporter n=1 Tax=Gulosibacter macacae TaxID=2488791 RepID=A0A3P3VY93_9MICO|nr:putative sulfate exporter family transporter [Gulosibacter macacae]RRJ87792.1 putative sulfate exporter family transporter [Gulosibacter macacae]